MKHKFFIQTAELLSKESKCCSLQVGAVIVRDDRIISTGYNGTISGTINCNDALNKGLFDRENHSSWSDSHEIHAEMNALMFAVKNGVATKDCIMYVTHEPCDQCLKNIVQAGIKQVIYLHPYKAEKCKSSYRYEDLIKINQFKEK